MYSGLTFNRTSGRIVGVHQRVDRVARKNLKPHVPSMIDFPKIDAILHFEGINGPDGMKRKSPGVDEPWHFVNPNNPDDKRIYIDIDDHLYNLTEALCEDNYIRAAFEAAWLAHAVVDGLTPPHHYPIEDKIEELWGKPYNERDSLKDKNIIHGTSKLDTLSKNWEYWGAKGVMTTHLNFEIGAALAISTEKFKKFTLSQADLDQVRERGFKSVYSEAVAYVSSLDMYSLFYKKGWTESLAREVREVLVPQMIRAVDMAWYEAILKTQDKM